MVVWQPILLLMVLVLTPLELPFCSRYSLRAIAKSAGSFILCKRRAGSRGSSGTGSPCLTAHNSLLAHNALVVVHAAQQHLQHLPAVPVQQAIWQVQHSQQALQRKDAHCCCWWELGQPQQRCHQHIHMLLQRCSNCRAPPHIRQSSQEWHCSLGLLQTGTTLMLMAVQQLHCKASVLQLQAWQHTCEAHIKVFQQTARAVQALTALTCRVSQDLAQRKQQGLQQASHVASAAKACSRQLL